MYFPSFGHVSSRVDGSKRAGIVPPHGSFGLDDLGAGSRFPITVGQFGAGLLLLYKQYSYLSIYMIYDIYIYDI